MIVSPTMQEGGHPLCHTENSLSETVPTLNIVEGELAPEPEVIAALVVLWRKQEPTSTVCCPSATLQGMRMVLSTQLWIG